MSKKLALGALRAGSGRTLAYCDVQMFEHVTILNVTLYQDANGEIKIGMPLKQLPGGRWTPTVSLSNAAATHLRKALHAAFLKSPLSQTGTAPSAGAEDDVLA